MFGQRSLSFYSHFFRERPHQNVRSSMSRKPLTVGEPARVTYPLDSVRIVMAVVCFLLLAVSVCGWKAIR